MRRPQQSGQSNLSPQDGADLWKAHIEPLKGQGLRLGTPAPSSAPSGKTWIQDWLTACDGGCNPDFVALRTSFHEGYYMELFITLFYIGYIDWYDVNATAFQEYLEDFHNTFQLPIWVTEWADQVCTYHVLSSESQLKMKKKELQWWWPALIDRRRVLPQPDAEFHGCDGLGRTLCLVRSDAELARR